MGKKKRTHVTIPQDTTTPRSLIFSSGNTSPSLLQLIHSVRTMFMPNTAKKLRSRKSNKLKDFLMVCGQLHISHLLIFTLSENVNLRMCKVPHGPTLSFRVGYSLAKDLPSKRRYTLSHHDRNQPPLSILHGFTKEKHVQLMKSVLENVFPPLAISTLQPRNAKRVVLFQYQDGIVHVRHYVISLRAKVSKRIQKVLEGQLGIDQFLSYASETESEGEEVDVQTETRAVKLREVGPRMDLELFKIVSGVCQGSVLYHKDVVKTQEQVQELEERVQEQRKRKAEARERMEQHKKAKEDDFEALLERAYQDEDDEADEEDLEEQDLEEVEEDLEEVEEDLEEEEQE
jgi:ribosome biogenesis protein SSF1/2